MQNKRKTLVWLYLKSAKNVASTYMRGYQLSEIIKRHLNNADVYYLNEESLKEIKNSIVFLTKGFLKKIKEKDLLILKSQNNVICTDFVDDPEVDWIIDFVDVLIASSITQSIYYHNKYPLKITHMITHHTDPDIPHKKNNLQNIKIGYFGELLNAKWCNELKNNVDFVSVNTKHRTRKWIDKLSDYNFHYAVRERRTIDGFKPFLKGYTAAKCDACIIVPESEGDSRFYLTHDYPYLLKNDDLETVREMIEFTKASYLKHDWKVAKDIMYSVYKRSTDEYVAEEVARLLLYL